MYATGTILKLKKPRPKDKETKEDFPYNLVRVIGESPVSHGNKGKWEGSDAKGVLIAPLSNFGSTLDEPFGKLRDLYDVESIPEVEIPVEQKIRIIDATTAQAGKTPEEVFAEESPGEKPKPGEKRGRTHPLGDPGGPVGADGPLGDNG